MSDKAGKILLLSDINSAHTQKWALALADKGYTLGLFTLNKLDDVWYKNHANIQNLSHGISFNSAQGSEVGKVKYLLALPQLLKAIKFFKPDILHAHYASSYGLLGVLSGFHPFILSVWGSDVYEFPRKSFLHRFLLKRNLNKADYILSTSKAMAIETAKYTDKEIQITPFGIDLELFKHQKVKSLFNEADIIIGTVKALEPKYGISYLIEAFDILCKKNPALPLKLLLAGKGSEESSLKALCRSKGIEDKVKFTGWIKPEGVPLYLNMIDIFAALSVVDSESFGVAVIEASACQKPVVVSDVSGFKEIVEHNLTGIIVPRRNADEAAIAIQKLLNDNSLRISMGAAGRERVEKLYNWKRNLEEMIEIYKGL